MCLYNDYGQIFNGRQFFKKDYNPELTKKHNFYQEETMSQLTEIYVNKEDLGNNVLVYVKKWMKTKHAIMFRLSNKIV